MIIQGIPLQFLIPVFLAGFIAGIYLFLKPESAIELQRKFYEKINWIIKPVSMPKEIRNNRAMGIMLAVISTAGALSLVLCR